MSALWPTENYSAYIKRFRDFQDNDEAICQSARQFEAETLLKLKYGIPIRQRRYAQVSCSSYGTGIDFYLLYHLQLPEIDTGYKVGKGRDD